MELTASPTDLIKLADAARSVDANPLRLAVRLAGLGIDEQRAGVPPWAWCAVALGLGVWIGTEYGPRIKRIVEE